jgi:hypothetical protein
LEFFRSVWVQTQLFLLRLKPLFLGLLSVEFLLKFSIVLVVLVKSVWVAHNVRLGVCGKHMVRIFMHAHVRGTYLGNREVVGVAGDSSGARLVGFTDADQGAIAFLYPAYLRHLGVRADS